MPTLNRENTAVIACGMLKNEVLRVMETHGLDYPVIWLEEGLHEFPEKLKKELRRSIAQCERGATPGQGEGGDGVAAANQDAPREGGKAQGEVMTGGRDNGHYIILLYGMCGYAVMGLRSSHTLVIPKFDDCVRMLMCREKGGLIPTRADRMYLTQAWVDSEHFILREFDRYVEDYGEEEGFQIARMMVGNYDGIDMIDDGTYDAMACVDRIREQARAYGLKCGCVRGTLRVLEKILLGEWDEEVVVKTPGSEVCLDDFDGRARCV